MAKEPKEPLTPREEDVLALLRRGLTNAQLASELGISENTAKDHVSKILYKLSAKTRDEAAYWPNKAPWWARAPLIAPLALFLRRSAARLPFSPSAAVTVLAGTTLIAVIAGLSLFAFLVLRTDGSDTPIVVIPAFTPATPAGAITFVNSPLLTSNRSKASVCLDVVDDAELTTTNLAVVQDSWGLIAADLSYSAETVLHLGCPPPAAMNSAYRFDDSNSNSKGPRIIGSVFNPSVYRVHLFLMTKSDYADIFGDLAYGFSTEEMFCNQPVSRQCAGVTSGIYFRGHASAEDIQKALRRAFGRG